MAGSTPRLWLDAKLDPEAQRLVSGNVLCVGPGAGGKPGSLEGIESVDGVIAGSRVRWNGALYERASRVRIVARSGIGYDNIDPEAATRAGVCVTNTPDGPTESTAEFTVTLILALVRRLLLADRRLRSEGWAEGPDLLGTDLAGKTLGLVGLGRIGSRVAELVWPFRMKIVACDPALDPATARRRGVELIPHLEELLGLSDVVSLHLPLVPQTRHLIGTRQLGLMKQGAILVNAARGPIIDGAAVAEAVKSGRLAGAGVDVWDVEPLTTPHPLVGLPNVIATPHIANFTVEGRRRNQVEAVQCALAVLDGRRPSTLVNPEVWSRRRSTP